MNARQCVAVRSSWVAMAILMCDNTLSVLFRDGFCCNYPRSTAAHFQALLAAPSKGHWLRLNLYKILPYRPIRLPCPPAGCGVLTNCCTGVQIPTTLHATVTGGGLANGSYALTYNAGSNPPTWQMNGSVANCQSSGTGVLQLQCVHQFTDAWALTGPGNRTYSPASVSCNPLSIVFNGVDFTPCGGNAGATVTVTT